MTARRTPGPSDLLPPEITAEDRAQVFIACRTNPTSAEWALSWLEKATCEQDRNLRMFCLKSVPSHLPSEKVIVAAEKTYHFATHPPDNPEAKPSGPGAPPGRRAAPRRAQSA